jgi:hypothetical protein
MFCEFRSGTFEILFKQEKKCFRIIFDSSLAPFSGSQNYKTVMRFTKLDCFTSTNFFQLLLNGLAF